MTTHQKSQLEKRLRKNIRTAREKSQTAKKYETRLRNQGRVAAYETCLFYLFENKENRK